MGEAIQAASEAEGRAVDESCEYCEPLGAALLRLAAEGERLTRWLHPVLVRRLAARRRCRRAAGTAAGVLALAGLAVALLLLGGR